MRTAAESVSEEELRADVLRLVAQWEKISARAKQARGPALLYREPDLAVRVIREELNADYRGVVIDDPELFAEVRDYVGAAQPRAGRPHRALRPRGRGPAALRAPPRPRAAPQGPRPQGLAAVGWLADHRAHRGADRHRRQHRQERRHVEPRGDRLPQQPRGGRRDRPAAAPARHRRHHRHRLHRHGDPGEPAQGGRPRSGTRWPGTRPARRSSTSPSSAWSR